MKYTVQIVCAVLGALPLVEIEAENDKSAVDQSRVLPVPHAVTEELGPSGQLESVLREQDKPTPLHLVPLEGGDYTVEVTCLEACPALIWDPADNEHHPGTRPAGFVVSKYEVTHEPHEALREQVDAQRAALEIEKTKAAERAALKAELLAEIADEQAAAGKGVSK